MQEKIGKGALKNYVELLKARLNGIVDKTDVENFCPGGFIVRLNNLSADVKKFLDAFAEEPASSFPYYVSRAAYLYAFGLSKENFE